MSLRDYLAVVKPRIIPLLVFVAVGASVIAAKGLPSPSVLIGVVVGGTLASAGSLSMNSYLEMGIDSRMKRTMNRPLPAHRIVPANHALGLGMGLLVAGVATAALTINVIATSFIALGAIVYVPIYTIFLKPRTVWNIVLGGFAGSCSVLAGWYAVTSSNPIVAWILAALVFVWTPSHFWSLAVIMEEDYSAVGIPMLPSVVGSQRASRYIVANTLILIPVSLLLAAFLIGWGLLVYLAGVVLFDAFLLATNIKMLRSPTKDNAFLAFKFSAPYLAVVFLIAMVAAVV
ncbi:MAG TPA: heme o synthase [Nitrososphaerales archaeon]|nr:heme o synthase [Nitrososphaerales archaeon]